MLRHAAGGDDLSLGDMLQRMALIAPSDLAAIEQIVRDVYFHADQSYRLRRLHPPQDMAAKYPWPKG